MNSYSYLNNSNRLWVVSEMGKGNGEWVSTEVFKCQANNILEADQLYQQATKQDVSKQKNISVAIHPIIC